MSEFYTRPIPNELWKPIKDNPEYWISNHGRVFSFNSDRFLKACPVRNQYHYTIPKYKHTSVRQILLDHFHHTEIIYDYGIPPKKVLIQRILSGKIGVYPHGNTWRFVIQKSGKQHARYFQSQEEARNNWLFMYCRINGINYEDTFNQVKSSGLYQRIDLRLN